MKDLSSTLRTLALHVLISVSIACALTGYHFYRMIRSKGEDSIGYAMLSLLVEWPLGNLLGGIVSVLALRPGVGVGRFALSALAAGTVAYFAAIATCAGIQVEPWNFIAGAAFLPLTSCLIVYYGGKRD